jgi:hypothetical protein
MMFLTARDNDAYPSIKKKKEVKCGAHNHAGFWSRLLPISKRTKHHETKRTKQLSQFLPKGAISKSEI